MAGQEYKLYHKFHLYQLDFTGMASGTGKERQLI